MPKGSSTRLTGALTRTLALTLALALTLTTAYTQGRLVLQGNAWVVIDNGAAVVLENPATNAITWSPGAGQIRSEAENDRIVWRIGTGVGTYLIPWSTRNSVLIPFALNITTPGTGAGSFVLSTHTDVDAVNNWDNFDYRPSDVTNMGGYLVANNSPNAIDRFWRVEGSGYTTMPQAALNFGYDDAERTAPGNTIPAGSLQAQRFSVPANGWLLPGLGVDNFPTPAVSGAIVTSNFHRSWTLATFNTPLPTAELAFSAQRDGAAARLDWSLENSTAVRSFHLERKTPDGNFQRIASHAAGQPHYTDWDRAPAPGRNTYRVAVEDVNGQLRVSESRSVFFGEEAVLVYPHPLTEGSNLQLMGFEGQEVDLQWVDLAGRILASAQVQAANSVEVSPLTPMVQWAAGVYVLQVRASGGFRQTLRILVPGN